MGLAAAAAIAASLATIATTTTTSVLAAKDRKKQAGLQKDQLEEEDRARERARKRQALLARSGSAGTILAPTGLGGGTQASVGKSTLLGG